MSCDCIKILEGLLTEKMMEKFPNGEVVEPVYFQNKTLVFNGDGTTSLILKNPTVGRVRIGKSIRKYDVNLFPKFCPYCGKPLKEEEGCSNE